MTATGLSRNILSMISLALFLSLSVQQGLCKTPPKAGDILPDFSLAAPVSSQESVYLGIEGKTAFSLNDIGAEVIIIEIMGVYCPQCHKQRPHINRLFHRIKAIPDLAEKIRFLGIATGSTPMEASYYSKQMKVPYPIVADETFDCHKRLGEPRTPFNMVVTRDGEVLYSHLGIIEDMNAFFTTLKKLTEGR